MTTTSAQSVVRPVFSLADDSESDPVPVLWAGSYLALGARLARHADSLVGRQLVVTLTVPRRDFVAALVGAGWTLTRPPHTGAGDPLSVARSLGPGAWCRAVNASHVYVGTLGEIDETVNPPRMRYAGSRFQVNGFRRLAPSDNVGFESRQDRPRPGSVARYTGADRDWDDRLVAPAQDLALVGIETRFRADLDAVISKTGDPDGDRLSTLLSPWHEGAVTWFSRIYSSAKLEAVPDGFEALILDGQGAIKFVAEVLSPIVVCIVDRSIADETQAENLVNMRRTEGTAVSIPEALGWRPPVGIEVMGFEVEL